MTDAPDVRLTGLLLAVAALLCLGCDATVAAPETRPEGRLDEASGIACFGGSLWIVGDTPACAGRVFELPLGDEPLADGLHVVDAGRLRVHAAAPRDAEDIEAVGRLFGTVVLLSEATQALWARGGAVIDYSRIEEAHERGGRGLEGAAIREPLDGPAFVAVLHEGGKENRRGHTGPARSPVIIVHRVARELAASGRTLLPDKADTTILRLDADVLASHFGTDDPIRAPGLAWMRSAPDGWVYVVLFGTDASRWLQRVRMDGSLSGPPLGLSVSMTRRDLKRNWEDLAWLDEEKRRLVLVEDNGGTSKTTHLFALTLPREW